MTGKNWLEVAKEKGLITEGPPIALDDSGDLSTTFRMVQSEGFTLPVAEYRFHPTRRWRFDYAWPDRLVALEREGGKFTVVRCECGRKRTVFVSRHHDRDGLERDAIKYATAAIMGWIVVRVTPRMIESGQAAELVLEALKSRGNSC